MSDIGMEKEFDILAELPCSQVIERQRGGVIYQGNRLPDGLYLVMDGYVKTWRESSDGLHRTTLEFHGIDDLFGETCVMPDDKAENIREAATALSKARLMFWPEAELRKLIYARPDLAHAFMMLVIGRLETYARRIEEMAVWTVQERLGRLLLRLGERFGAADAASGMTAMPAVTHEALAEYTGTSREIVTSKLNAFRRHGLVSYSRKGITFCAPDLLAWLEGKIAEHSKAA